MKFYCNDNTYNNDETNYNDNNIKYNDKINNINNKDDCSDVDIKTKAKLLVSVGVTDGDDVVSLNGCTGVDVVVSFGYDHLCEHLSIILSISSSATRSSATPSSATLFFITSLKEFTGCTGGGQGANSRIPS